VVDERAINRSALQSDSPTRRFLARAAALLLIPFIASGCGRMNNTADDPNTLVVAMSTFSEATFLPWNGSTGRKFYLDTIYEYLVYLDPASGELRPGLAERWEMSPDGRAFTLWLRQGIPFQQGWGEVTAHDVKYTLDRIRDPKSIAGPSSPLRKAIAEVNAPETYKVVVTLKTPDIDFLRGYLSNGQVIPIVSRRYVTENGDEHANAHPIGTGAYEFTEYRQGVSIAVSAGAHAKTHWRVKPEFQHLRFLAVPEEFTRAAMLKTGEADLAPINYDSIQALERAGLRMMYVRHNWAPVIRFGGLTTRFSNPAVPWAKKEVRQALNYALDKQTIVRAIFHGQASIVGADFPAPEWESIAPYDYDPERAKALLSQAGYPDGFNMRLLTYTTTPGAELQIIAQTAASYWQAIGVRVTIEPTSWPTLRGAWTNGSATDIAWTHRGLAFSGTLPGLHASVMSESVFASYANAETDARVQRISDELDPTERARLTTELGEYLHEEAGAVFIGFANEPYAMSRKIESWPALSQQGTNIDLVTRRKH
jgi:peptide/nickel transport system substrate-binding protein